MTGSRPRLLWLVPALLLAALGLALLVLRRAESSKPFSSAGSSSNAALRTPPPQPIAAMPRTAESSAPIREQAAEAAAGEISGQVISAESREGIGGAELTWSSPRGAHSAQTDPQGRFTFRPPEPGRYQLASARAEGYLPFGPEWGKSPVQQTFRVGQRVRGVVVELTPSPDVVARVLDARGARVPGATARVLAPRKDEIALFPMRDRFTADARGEFVFHAEPYAIVEAFHPTAGTGSARLERAARELIISLEPMPPDAGPRVSLSGRVISGGRGVAGALVHASSALRAYPRVFGSSDGYRELTDEDGRFELNELQPGTYDLSAHLLGLAPAHRFDVRAPQSDVVLELGSGSRLSGQVTEEGGAPVPAFDVSLSWRKAPLERMEIVETGFVDPDGRYRIEGIAPGTYELEVRAVGFTPSMVPVTVGAFDATTDVRLRRGPRVTGTVRSGDTHAPIAQARVALEGGGPATLTDGAGAFTLEGLSRSGFSLQISAAGHHTRVATVTDPSAPVEIELTPLPPDAGVKTELVGIGAVLKGRGDALVIGQVMPGGGAQAAGIVPGDEVVSVDGHLVADLGFEASIRAIRGPVETSVELQLRKGGEPPLETLVVNRRKITN
jgi:hypothetical protein